MAKVDEKVMSLVEEELQKNPSASVDELYDKAKSASPAVGKLSKRQFNARYPLQIKRRTARKGGSKKKRSVKKAPRRASRAASADGGARDAIRDVFLRFASDLAAAEQRKDLVKVLAGVDKYVDEVGKIAAK